jgi:hypothetical protein
MSWALLGTFVFHSTVEARSSRLCPKDMILLWTKFEILTGSPNRVQGVILYAGPVRHDSNGGFSALPLR